LAGRSGQLSNRSAAPCARFSTGHPVLTDNAEHAAVIVNPTSQRDRARPVFLDAVIR